MLTLLYQRVQAPNVREAQKEQRMAASHKIEISTMSFPDETAVKQGDSVVWTNRMSMRHTVTADNGEFDSGQLSKDQSFSWTFNAAGTIRYHCKNHPDDMTGAIVVS
jgi:plastocyanin